MPDNMIPMNTGEQSLLKSGGSYYINVSRAFFLARGLDPKMQKLTYATFLDPKTGRMIVEIAPVQEP